MFHHTRHHISGPFVDITWHGHAMVFGNFPVSSCGNLGRAGSFHELEGTTVIIVSFYCTCDVLFNASPSTNSGRGKG